LYGRRLIKTERVDTVFGNPERAKGGTHWVIVGSSFLLLVWLYYSWDMAKSFLPKSANYLCQVAKVNESLRSLKYLFPIEERELKSTSIIKLEGKNIKKYEIKIQNSSDLNDQNKSKLLKFLTKTKNTIPLLTNEIFLENKTKNKINEITSKINNLTEEFKKINYASETFEEKNKRLEALKNQGEWGASGTALDNVAEIPAIPASKKGLKFDVASKELILISDEFFKLRNHNPKYKIEINEIKDNIKKFRSELDETQEVTSTFAKDILKIARRIEYARIYPPNALNQMKNAIVEFDNVQKDQQGGLRFVDIFLFPAGTSVASGPSCSEQGSGRWLPKPSDTFNKFILMSKPSVGYKNIPLLWIDMVDVSKINPIILRTSNTSIHRRGIFL
jgi:taurine transport system permease protein